MGIALSTLSSLSNLVRASRRWLRDTPAAEAHPAFQGEHPARQGAVHAAASGEAPSLAKVAGHTPPGPRQRPVRGNWPFTAGLPPAAATPPAAGKGEAGRTPPAQAPLPRRNAEATFRSDVRAGAGSCRRSGSTTVVRKTLVPDAGRLVIAGRMADVCAELDRMVACEAALRTC